MSVPRVYSGTRVLFSYMTNAIGSLIFWIITLQRLIIMTLCCYFSKMMEQAEVRSCVHSCCHKLANILHHIHFSLLSGCQDKKSQFNIKLCRLFVIFYAVVFLLWASKYSILFHLPRVVFYLDMRDLPKLNHPRNPKFQFVWVAPVCMAGSATEGTVK